MNSKRWKSERTQHFIPHPCVPDQDFNAYITKKISVFPYMDRQVPYDQGKIWHCQERP